jgi:hypothetical protein
MKRKIGWGTASIALLLLSILWSSNISRTFCLGDVVLGGIGLKAYSGKYGEGMHYTIFYSLGMLVAGYLMGRLFPKDFGAKVGRRLCAVLGVVLLILLLLMSSFLFYFK